MPVAWREETLINTSIKINLNVGLTELKEIGLCNVSDCWIYNTEYQQQVYLL